ERNRRAATANICQKGPLGGQLQLTVVVVMDPIGSVNIAKDSTFAMLLEAQRRGHALRYVQPGSLGMVHGQAYANLAPLTVRDDRSGWYELGPSSHRALGPGDLVLMRKDPPVDADFLHRSEEHTSELQSRENLVCRLLLEKKKHKTYENTRLP